MALMFVLGSILLSCSHFGAYVIGSDIDYTLLHGRGIFDNFY